MGKDRAAKRLAFMIFMFVGFGIFTLLYFLLLGNTTQRFNDYVIDFTAYFALNKTIEINLLRILVLAGCALYFLFFLLTRRRFPEGAYKTVSKEADESLAIAAAVMTSAAVIFVFYTDHAYFDMLFAALAASCAVAVIKDKKMTAGVLVLAFFTLYAVLAVYEIMLLAGYTGALNTVFAAVTVFAVSAVCTLLPERLKAVKRASLVLQLAIPFLLLAMLFSKYRYNGGFVTVAVPKRAIVLVAVFIVLFEAENIMRLVKNSDDIISCGTCAAIMAFNRFNGMGPGLVSEDMRHPYENIIGWFRYFERGEVPYETSISVSGLFSVVQGAFFKFMGGGKIAYYNLTENLFYFLAATVIVLLLRKHIKGFYTFVIALMFTITEYNRYTFVLPFALVLLLPEVMKRKDLWLKLWFVTSLFMGLYYPLFGAAYCLGFMPLGIWQAVSFAKTGELKKAAKKPMFWLTWALCLAPAVFFAKLLIKMMIHIKIMGGQTVLSDGMSRFAEKTPDNWMSYLSETNFVRLALYDIFTFLLPAALVWLTFALALGAGKAEDEGKLKFKNLKGLLILMGGVIFMLVSFTSTTVRLAVGNLFVRSDGVLCTVCVLLLVYACKKMQNNKFKYMLLCALFVFPCFSGHVLASGYFTEVGYVNALTRHSGIPDLSDKYVYTDNKDDAKLYDSFIEKGMYEKIAKYRRQTEKYDPSASYSMVYPTFLHYYINDIKTASLMESGTARDFYTSREAAEFAEKNNGIIGTELDPVLNYYLKNWLYTSGAYVWSEEYQAFVPNSEGLSAEEVKKRNKKADSEKDLIISAHIAASTGASMETLSGIFEKKDIELSFYGTENGMGIGFDRPVNGDEADFIYIGFSGLEDSVSYALTNRDNGLFSMALYDDAGAGKYLMKRVLNADKEVVLQWDGENGETCSISCVMGGGKLLIPLGANTDWLLNDHTEIRLMINADSPVGAQFGIEDIYFLKLREI